MNMIFRRDNCIPERTVNSRASKSLMNCHLTYFEMGTYWKLLKKMRSSLNHVDSHVARREMQVVEHAVKPFKKLLFATQTDKHKMELTKQIRNEIPDINDKDLNKELERRVNEMLPMEIQMDADTRERDRKHRKRPNWRNRDEMQCGKIWTCQ